MLVVWHDYHPRPCVLTTQRPLPLVPGVDPDEQAGSGVCRTHQVRGQRLGLMSENQNTVSAVVKAGMARACRDFTERIGPYGFRRTNSRSRAWERQGERFIHVIYFHRRGSSYGAPYNHDVDIRVHFSLQNLNGEPAGASGLTSEHIRDQRGYAYHLRFNALSWSMYDRCLDDLIRLTREHGLSWFERNTA